MDRALHRIRTAGRAPTPAEVLDDLIDLHTARPGITEATLGRGRTADGRTSYEVLVDHAPASARTFLDLGCGNGPLLEALHARRTVDRAIGVDACAPEIERARERLSRWSQVELHVSTGQDMPIEASTVDAVLSHHAFYLFDPVEPAIARIHQVLRPGGTFAFATLSPEADRYPLFAELMRVYSALTRRDNHHFPRWGDARVWSREGLDGLFSGFGGSVALVPEVLVFEGSPAELADTMMRFYYSIDLQSPETQREQRAVWTERLAGGRLEWPFGVAKVEKRS